MAKQRQWIIVSKNISDVAEKSKKDKEAKEQKSYFFEEEHKDEPISLEIAFELDKEGNFVKESKESKKLFSYLETEEVTDFKFHVNSNFVLNPNRERLFGPSECEPSEWNECILSGIAFANNGINRIFKENDKLKLGFYGVIPLPASYEPSNWLKKLLHNGVMQLLTEFKTREIILDSKGQFRRPDCILVPPLMGERYEIFQNEEIFKDLQKYLVHKLLIEDNTFKEIIKSLKIPLFNDNDLLTLLKKRIF